MNINGWQRIWIIFTLLWIGFIFNYHLTGYYGQWVADMQAPLIRSFYTDPNDMLLDNRQIPKNKVDYSKMTNIERKAYRAKAKIAEDKWRETKRTRWSNFKWGESMLRDDYTSLEDVYRFNSDTEIIDSFYKWSELNYNKVHRLMEKLVDADKTEDKQATQNYANSLRALEYKEILYTHNKLEEIKAKNREKSIDRVIEELPITIAPPAIIYLFGVLIGWIRRGFSK